MIKRAESAKIQKTPKIGGDHGHQTTKIVRQKGQRRPDYNTADERGVLTATTPAGR